MGFQNQVEAVAEIGSKMYAENAELQAKLDLMIEENKRLDGYLRHTVDLLQVVRKQGNAFPDESVSEMLSRLQARAESAEAERDRLRAALDTELATERSALAHDRELRDALTAERDRLRDALIACRPAVHLHSIQMTRRAIEDGGWKADEFEEAKRIAALLDTIDAAAKGQG